MLHPRRDFVAALVLALLASTTARAETGTP